MKGPLITRSGQSDRLSSHARNQEFRSFVQVLRQVKANAFFFVLIMSSILSWWSTTAKSADVLVTPANFDQAPNTLFILGEIEDGDYEKVIARIKNAGFIPRMVSLDSPGGDVITAMRIGRFFRDSLITSMVDHGSQCNSSCVLIVLGGPTRIVLSPVGIHRPYYEREYFSNLSATDASKKYREMDVMVREYLAEMDVPNAAIEMIMATKSNDVNVISPEEFFLQFGVRTPAQQEWILAKCGGLSESEEVDANAADAIGSMEVYEKWLREGTDYATPENIRKMMSQMAPQVEYGKTLSSGYRDYLQKKKREITACHIEAVVKHQKQVFDNLQSLFICHRRLKINRRVA